MLSKIKNKLLDKLLKEDGLCAVAKSWQDDYVKIIGERLQLTGQINELVKAYNDLLLDNLNRCSIKELKEMIKDADGLMPKDPTKENLVNVAFIEYQMRKM